MCPVREVAPEAVPGKLGGKTGSFAAMPEFREMSAAVKAGLTPGKAYEVEIDNGDNTPIGDKRTLEGFKRAFRKLHSQRVYAYDIAVRGSLIYVVGTDKPLDDGTPKPKKARKKK